MSCNTFKRLASLPRLSWHLAKNKVLGITCTMEQSCLKSALHVPYVGLLVGRSMIS
jgi:hypothetical protein